MSDTPGDAGEIAAYYARGFERDRLTRGPGGKHIPQATCSLVSAFCSLDRSMSRRDSPPY